MESEKVNANQYFRDIVNNILKKVRHDPSSITTADARRLSENVVVNNQHTARIISAVEFFANASEAIYGVDPSLGQTPHTSLLTAVRDLVMAIDQNPTDVTAEVLKLAQGAVGKMQKALGQANAPQPELDAESQEEVTRIEPKVAQGTITNEEASHLHLIEARAHGHTEKGGIASIALSNGSIPTTNRTRAKSATAMHLEQPHQKEEGNSHSFGGHTKAQVQQDTVAETGESGDLAPSKQSAFSKTLEESLSDWTKISNGSTKQPQPDSNMSVKLAELTLEPKTKTKPEHAKQDMAAQM
ncbi:hypothetical protein GQ44DRAFT_601333 [Phaeosphaeriaceae sp. PMI808]|nr:hypothetical protein GQ44DRAFT_601333 [Phaeosphaeriaceae sp. PMI808]